VLSEKPTTHDLFGEKKTTTANYLWSWWFQIHAAYTSMDAVRKRWQQKDGFKYFFMFTLTWGNDHNLTNIFFQMG